MNLKSLIGGLCLAILLAACEKAPPAAQPPRPALVTIVGNGLSNNSMVLVGEVKSRYESNLGFRIKGKIIARMVEVGSLVNKGQVIVRLDASDVTLNTQAATADVRAAEASYSLAKAEVERQRLLFNKKFISQSALDLREAELKTAGARVAQAKAQAAVAGNQTQYTTLLADRAGVVTQIRAEPGQVVDAGEVIVQLIDPASMEVLVAVPELRMAHIKSGDPVEIKLWAQQEKTYAGKIREIAPAANPSTRAFDVRVAILNPDENIKFGMTAGVNFGQNAETNIVVPSTALTQVNGQNVVWVIDPQGIAQPRKVLASEYNENGIQIRQGLKAGEMVAIAGIHTLVKGQKVRPKIEAQP